MKALSYRNAESLPASPQQMETAVSNDPFRYLTDSPMSPAEQCFEITPSDSQDLPTPTKALFIGEGGDVALVTLRGNSEITFRNLQSGSILDVRVKAVRASGTTAASLVGLS